MQPFKRISRAAFITVLATGTAAAAGPATPALEAELAVLVAAAQAAPGAAGVTPAPAEPTRVTWSSDGYVRYLGAPADRHFPVNSTTADQPELTAKRFLQQHARMFGVHSPAVDFRLVKQKEQKGRHYLRFQQHYAGLPVFAAHVTVQLDAQDGVAALLSDIERDPRRLDDGTVSLVPTVTATEAVLAASALLAPGAPASAFSNTAPALVVFSPTVVGQSGEIRLAWDFRLATDSAGRRAERMLVDAHGGQVIYRYSLIHSALGRLISDHFTFTATTNQDGSVSYTYPWVRSEGEPPVANFEANRAYDGIGDAYQFYLLEHGRTNWVSFSQNQQARVRFCETYNACPWANAQYDSFWPRMDFGDGWTPDDVVGHEYTHGVTDSESSLIYQNASGAINESFSDIWGEFVDLTNVRGNDSSSVRWDVGEDLPAGRIRSMKDPTVFNHPDRLGSQHYVPPPSQPTQGNDYGGVHSNSGVGNKLCYLLTDGDTFNGSTVTGVGIFSVAELFYEANANLLQPASDWTDLNDALSQAAINIGWNSTQRANLYRACRAVEIAPPSDLYVDKTSVCLFPAGLPSCFTNFGPYLSVRQGVTNALAGDTLHIRATNYNETLTFSNRLTLQPYNGPVTIGKP